VQRLFEKHSDREKHGKANVNMQCVLVHPSCGNDCQLDGLHG
jgi:hypothetical protein